MSSPVVRFTAVTGTEDATTLSAVERERCARLRDPGDRAAFVAAHLLVRECAGELLGRSAREVIISQSCPRCSGPHGRPTVPGQPDLHLSLSHARTHVAAVAAWSRCGIDVERVGRLEPVRSALTAGERAWLAGQPDPDTAFGRLWVRKEALVKAGLGSLDTLHVVDTLAHSEHLTDWSGPGTVGAWAVLN